MDPGLIALLSAIVGGILGAGGAVLVQVLSARRVRRDAAHSRLYDALADFARLAQDAQETEIHAWDDHLRKQRVTAGIWVGYRLVLLAAPGSTLVSSTYRIAETLDDRLWNRRGGHLLDALNPLWQAFEDEAVIALAAIDRGRRPPT